MKHLYQMFKRIFFVSWIVLVGLLISVQSAYADLTISVTVKDCNTGRSIQGATVSIPTSKKPGKVYSTNSQGFVSIFPVRPGNTNHKIVIQADGYQQYVINEYIEANGSRSYVICLASLFAAPEVTSPPVVVPSEPPAPIATQPPVVVTLPPVEKTALPPAPVKTEPVQFLCAGFGRCDAVTFPREEAPRYKEQLERCLHGVQQMMLEVVPDSEVFVAAMKTMNIALTCKNDRLCQFYSGFKAAWDELVVKEVSKKVFGSTAPGVMFNLFLGMAQNEGELRTCEAVGPVLWGIIPGLQKWLNEQDLIFLTVLHSPATVLVYDQEGHMTGFHGGEITSSQIPGSAAVLAGEAKVVLAPAGAIAEVKLMGTGSGPIGVDVIQPGKQNLYDYSFDNVPVTPNTRLALNRTDFKLQSSDGLGSVYVPTYLTVESLGEEIASPTQVSQPAEPAAPLMSPPAGYFSSLQRWAVQNPLVAGLALLLLGLVIGLVIAPRMKRIGQLSIALPAMSEIGENIEAGALMGGLCFLAGIGPISMALLQWFPNLPAPTSLQSVTGWLITGFAMLAGLIIVLILSLVHEKEFLFGILCLAGLISCVLGFVVLWPLVLGELMIAIIGGGLLGVVWAFRSN